MSLQILSIPVLNRYDLLERMISSIDYDIDEILIINNGKEKYVPKNKYFNFRILDLPSNIGCAASWNLTVKLYPHLSYWAFASADIIWKPGSIEKMVKKSNKELLCLSNQHTSAFSWGENLVRDVGLFDENYYPIYVEYKDYRQRMINYGLKDNIILNAFEINGTDDGTTVKSNSNFIKKNLYTELKNEEYFKNKKENNNWTDTFWNIDIRRDQEWEE